MVYLYASIRFFDDFLTVADGKKRRIDRIALDGERVVLRDIVLPRQRFCTLEQFLERFRDERPNQNLDAFGKSGTDVDAR